MRIEVVMEAVNRYIIPELPEELVESTYQLYCKYALEGLPMQNAVKKVKNENTLNTYEVYGILMYKGIDIKASGRVYISEGLRRRIKDDNLEQNVPHAEVEINENESDEERGTEKAGKKTAKANESVVVVPLGEELDKLDERIDRAMEIIEKYKELLKAINNLIEEVNHDRA